MPTTVRASGDDLPELEAVVEDGSITPLVDRPCRLDETPPAMRYPMAAIRAATWS